MTPEDHDFYAALMMPGDDIDPIDRDERSGVPDDLWHRRLGVVAGQRKRARAATDPAGRDQRGRSAASRSSEQKERSHEPQRRDAAHGPG